MDLYISSGYHITTPQNRINAIEDQDQFGEVDIVFAEAPLADNPVLRSIFLNLISAPLLMSVMYLWASILYISNKLLSTDDGIIIDHFKHNHQSVVVKTDINMNRLIAKNRLLWLISHALIIIISALAVPGFISVVQFDSTLIAILLLLALAGAAVFAIVLAVIDPVRNRTMAEDILQRAEDSHNAQAVLVIGNHHKEPIVDLLQGESKINIQNPD